VDDDHYVVDEGHETLVFQVAPTVTGTVLVKGATGYRQKAITIAQLAQLVAGKRPVDLYEPLSTGVWISVHVDSVRTFAQQYAP
jgi:hypothetical protein